MNEIVNNDVVVLNDVNFRRKVTEETDWVVS